MLAHRAVALWARVYGVLFFWTLMQSQFTVMFTHAPPEYHCFVVFCSHEGIRVTPEKGNAIPYAQGSFCACTRMYLWGLLHIRCPGRKTPGLRCTSGQTCLCGKLVMICMVTI
jgi:hypothetical protein